MSDLLSDLRQRMDIRQIPGLSIRVAEKSKTLFCGDFGVRDLLSGEPLKPTDVFRIGCLTKPIVAYVVLQLAHQKQLDLGDSVVSYIPELIVSGQFGSITVKHLLCHTSGLARGPYYSQRLSDKNTLFQINSAQLLFTPGENFKYSNWGYFLLGKVIENITGDTVESYIEKAVFSPLSMEGCGFSGKDACLEKHLATGYWKGWYFGSPNLAEPSVPCPHIPLPAAGGGMITTTDSYLRWLMRFIGQCGHGCAVNPGVVEQMLMERHEVSPSYSVCMGLFMEVVEGVPFYYFVGNSSGFSGFIFMIPSLNLTGVALANHDTCNNELRDILYQVCREKINRSELPVFGRCVTKANFLAGNRARMVRFKREEKELPVLAQKNCQTTLYPHSRNAFFMLNSSEGNHMLRIRSLGSDDRIVTLGEQVFYEKLSRLRKRPAIADSWKVLTGLYCHSVFGKVSIIYREHQLFLSYGVVYEVLLEPIEGLRFKQKPGAFCFETIEFKKRSDTGTVDSFVLNRMIFNKLN